MFKNKGGFTLIELVMIIVILGILAAIAIPRYVDLKDDANKANAKGVVGGLNSAASVAFAAKLTNRSRCNPEIGAAANIDAPSELASCLDGGLPSGWSYNEGANNFIYNTGATSYGFTFSVETGSAKASVAKTAQGSTWPD